MEEKEASWMGLKGEEAGFPCNPAEIKDETGTQVERKKKVVKAEMSQALGLVWPSWGERDHLKGKRKTVWDRWPALPRGQRRWGGT